MKKVFIPFVLIIITIKLWSKLGEKVNMKANKKFVEEDEAVSAVIGVILMVAITVAIAATVYAYVSGMIGTETRKAENASVTAHGLADKAKLILAQEGQNYPTTGYLPNTINIFIEGEKVDARHSWIVGGQILIGTDAAGWTSSNTETVEPGDYSITVSVMDTVVYNGVVTVT